MDELIRDRVKIEWVELGEGWSGDYQPDDPDDEELLRFDVSRLDDGEWNDQLQDASYCTAFPAKATKEQRTKGLKFIMNQCYDDVISDNYKRTLERMSWINLDWLKEN
ncbi:hypothetical protein MUP59_05640 [Candidatus Bathyarchaeota archaeon]|nr:hypothetical protein [Candidatus Bathyarchaeota archaeon]